GFVSRYAITSSRSDCTCSCALTTLSRAPSNGFMLTRTFTMLTGSVPSCWTLILLALASSDLPLGSVEQDGARPRGLALRLISRGLVDDCFLRFRERDAHVGVHQQPAAFPWSCHAGIVVKKIEARQLPTSFGSQEMDTIYLFTDWRPVPRRRA